MDRASKHFIITHFLPGNLLILLLIYFLSFFKAWRNYIKIIINKIILCDIGMNRIGWRTNQAAELRALLFKENFSFTFCIFLLTVSTCISSFNVGTKPAIIWHERWKNRKKWSYYKQLWGYQLSSPKLLISKLSLIHSLKTFAKKLLIFLFVRSHLQRARPSNATDSSIR